MNKHPLIAVVGHPNEGKSSVLSTLAEDDSVVVNDYPGETVRCQYFPVRLNGEILFEFVDTPGFQNPTRVLEWMQASGLTDDALLQAFLNEFESKPEFRHDCELMQPLRQGAGLIYVVDASRPLMAVDEAEMEILRLINKPRMALINFKEEDRSAIANWQQAFRRHFNVIREFNAHQADFKVRMGLLQALKAMHQEWEPAIDKAIEAYTADWALRAQQTAEGMAQYLRFAVELKLARNCRNESKLKATEEQAQSDYRRAISQREQDLFQQIRSQYHHNVFDIALPEQSILKEDLFSEQTWQMLGLTQKQLILAASGAGAGVGAAVDLLAHGFSLGLFAATGALAAGGMTWLKGDELAKIKVKRLPLGELRVVVGPNTNPQFPLVLLDRLLLFFQLVAAHAHGNRQEVSLDETLDNDLDKNQGLLQSTERSTQQHWLTLFRQLSSKHSSERQEAEQAVTGLLRQTLDALVSEEDAVKSLNSAVASVTT